MRSRFRFPMTFIAKMGSEIEWNGDCRLTFFVPGISLLNSRNPARRSAPVG